MLPFSEHPCKILDIKDTTYLTETAENQGIGRVGDIVPQTIEDLALKVKSAFGLDSVRLVRYNHDINIGMTDIDSNVVLN